jgi:hypothetical protein
MLVTACGKSAKEPVAQGDVTAAAHDGSQAANPSGLSADAVKESGCLNPPTQEATAEHAIFQFLEAYRAGDDKRTEAMFTERAKKQIAALGYKVTPPRSDTASFKIGTVTPVKDEQGEIAGAQVEIVWSDLNDKQQRQHENMMWVLRKEPEGWRVAGAAVNAIPGENPLLLDFENLEETILKLKKAKDLRDQREQAAEQPADGTAPVPSAPATTQAASPAGDATNPQGAPAANPLRQGADSTAPPTPTSESPATAAKVAEKTSPNSETR